MTKRDTILVVDDMEINRTILCSVFEKDYNILEAENGEQALLFLKQYHGQIAAVLLDLVMPVMDGYQVMEEINKRGFLQEFPVIIITAEDGAQNEVKIFDIGASDIIIKPFEPHVVRRRVQNILELNLRKLNQEELIEEQAAKLRQSNEAMVDALSSIIEYRSVETGQHIQRIRMFTKVLLEEVARIYPEFGLDERKINIIVSASSMHDIGKIAIPDAILNKPGPLTKEEFEIMKTHAVKGCEMLAGLDRVSDREYLGYAYNICRYHHERWDGRGYPDGLKGNSIPVCAQVVGIADCYDALTTNRVYKKAIPVQQALNMILNGECGVFSPGLLECLKNVKEIFAGLTAEYADGKPHKKESVGIKRSLAPMEEDKINTAQMKYFAMLRYVGDTVMEIDLNTGVYHVVYMADDNFNMLKSESSFEDTIKNFISNAVYPQDREIVWKFIMDSGKQFFNGGLMKSSCEYRIYDKGTEAYFKYRNTLVRIDIDNPGRKKGLLVWERLKEDKLAETPPDSLFYKDVVLHNVVVCLQKFCYDEWFTVPEMSDGLAELLGYTKEEVEKKFKNRFIDIIYPGDREMVRHQVESQLRTGKTIEQEYRVIDRSGKIVWLLGKGKLIVDTDGNEYIYEAVLDITKSKEDQEELRLTLERHKIIMEQTNDIIFEWDILKDQVIYSSNWIKKFGYEPIKDNIRKKLSQVSHIHPQDCPLFLNFLDEFVKGVPYRETKIRLADGNGRYRWCRVRATAQFDPRGRALKVVGILNDADNIYMMKTPAEQKENPFLGL